jgi:serine/threonine protein phosphatase PrpC
MELVDGLKTELIQQITREGFAKSMLNMQIICFSIADLAFKNDDRYKVSPKDMLIEAVNDNREIGSCTCVLATLDEKAPLLYTANLGDSGYMILRKEGLDLIKIYRTKEQ